MIAVSKQLNSYVAIIVRSHYASASRDYSQNNWSFALVLQIPFNFLDSMTIDAQRNTAGQNTQRVTYSHAKRWGIQLEYGLRASGFAR